MATSTRFTQRNPPVSADSENAEPPAFKSMHPHKFGNVPKRAKAALGDITNTIPISDHPHAHIFKPLHASKIRRNAAPSSSKLAKKPSPMSTTSSLPRRASDRLAKRAAAALAAAESDPAPCRLDFATPSTPSAHCDPIDRLRLPTDVCDIDRQDDADHRFVSDLACEIHQNFILREHRFLASPHYMASQHDITIKMRAVLIDWLVDVHQKFRLQPETLHLTVNILDRFLEVQPVMRRKLQLVGVTSMLIASKYEEIYAPEVADFVYISDRAYSKPEIIAMEAMILNKLQFEVTVPSSLTFMQRCLKAFTATTGGVPQDANLPHEAHTFLTHYLVELALQDSRMLAHRHSVRAAAACKLAAKLCNIPLPWDATMEYHCGGWSATELSECEQDMIQLLEHEQDVRGTNKLTAIKRKFASQKYFSISTYMVDLTSSQPMSMDICAE